MDLASLYARQERYALDEQSLLDAIALREPEHLRNVLGAAGMDDGVREAVDNLAAVGPVARARGPIGPEEHGMSVASAPGRPLCRIAQCV